MQFEDYVAARGQALLRYAYVLCGDAHEADDLVASGLAKAYRHWSKVTSAAHPDAYVRRIVTNQFTDSRGSAWARVRLMGELPDRAAQGALADPADRVTVHDELQRALRVLPRKQRAVLVLRHYEGYSDAAIAEVLDCGEGAVRSNASRGLATLRTLLDSSADLLDRPADSTMKGLVEEL